MIHPCAPPLRRSYADGPFGQIHYYDGGGNGTPLLLLHQSPAASSDWFPIVPFLLAGGIRVLAMDTPGMGLSDPWPHTPEIADYALAVESVLDHAGVEQADVLGHHTGVQIAVEAAVLFPDRIRSASLYGIPMMSAEELAKLWQQIVPREKEGALHRAVTGGTNLLDHFTLVERMFSPAAAQRLLLSALLAGPLWWHGHNAALQHDMTPSFLAMRQPLLLISHPGEMLDANTRAAAALRPDARFISLAVEGPVAMDDDPSQLADAVIGFVRSLG